MLSYDNQYQDILRRVKDDGISSSDRTGVGTTKIFDANIRVDLSSVNGKYVLPILTLRKVFPRSAWYEMVWMLRGSLDARELQEKNIHIWDGNSSREFLDSRGLHHIVEGFIGSAGYGSMFRNFEGVDQLVNVIQGLIENPNGRRHYISLWNPAELHNMALPCCHVAYNFMVTGDKLNLKFFQRSSDFILAGNANMMFSAFFLSWMSHLLGYKVGSLSHSITDCHVYNNHLGVLDTLLERSPMDHTATFDFPDNLIKITDTHNLKAKVDEALNDLWDDSVWQHIKDSIDYQCHDAIPKESLIMAV